LLALGRYADAAAAVAAVPDDYKYQVVLDPHGHQELDVLASFAAGDKSYQLVPATPSVGDREGGNGLDYRSSGDPRTLAVLLGQDISGYDMYFPAKHTQDPNSLDTLMLADGVEARLIEAEAALQVNATDGRWLALLNHLRQTALLPDTVLPDLADPGTDAAGKDTPRVDQLFRERAFWLYLTGHRQGDLRRLIRQYQRSPDLVYPTGFCPGAGGFYGAELTVPVPPSEQDLNPKYIGCFHHNA
jgi:hypothetical protein